MGAFPEISKVVIQLDRKERRTVRKVRTRTKLIAGAIAAVGLTAGAVAMPMVGAAPGGVPGPNPAAPGQSGVHGQEKVSVCHVGEEEVTDPVTGEVTVVEVPHTIVVAAPAVSAHLAHGDTLGACAVA